MANLLLITLIMHLAVCLCAIAAPMSKVNTIRRSGAASTDTYLKYLGEIPELAQLTFCFRLYLTQARDEIMVLSYAHPEDDDELYIGFHYRNKKLVMRCCNRKWERDVKLKLELRSWSSICVALDLAGGNNEVLQDGLIKFGVENDILDPLHVRGGGLIYIGQEQDRPGGGFTRTQSFAGSLVDLRLYDKNPV
ncbi:neuronal pentraxin-1-like [Penaeus monodon]|uniref:neuronal pentraxin-1-like n=1 Tax=Penaeus monodon TaxID=6687 RepID=UPI0018A72645|nr:neuronal pentraxin-1-like [Penaeus monodon]